MLLHYVMKKKQVAAEHLLHTQTTFSQSVMILVGGSRLGVTDLIFVDLGAMVNGYCDVFLSQQLLPVMHDVSAKFQQDTAPAHRAHDTVRLLEATPALFQRICGRQTVLTSIQMTS